MTHEVDVKVPGIETWSCATDPLVFKASSPEQMLSLLVARVHSAIDVDRATTNAGTQSAGAARSLCGWLLERGDSLPTPAEWMFDDSPGTLLNKMVMAWSLYSWAATEKTLTPELRSALIEAMTVATPDAPDLTASMAASLEPGADLSRLAPVFVDAASQALHHLLTMAQGLVDLYALRDGDVGGQPS